MASPCKALKNGAHTAQTCTGSQPERDKCGSWTAAWKRNPSEFHQRLSAAEPSSRVMVDLPAGDRPTVNTIHNSH